MSNSNGVQKGSDVEEVATSTFQVNVPCFHVELDETSATVDISAM
jgi:hypothetical protein